MLEALSIKNTPISIKQMLKIKLKNFFIFLSSLFFPPEADFLFDCQLNFQNKQRKLNGQANFCFSNFNFKEHPLSPF
ncbi:hypothetical protein KJ586_00550 [Patescibacteria group bacterium]|nr:hypothetical protein [Patescibacteria group bacterium]MBU4347652.1 hypothetical protein [Patescibacteria group bacterium]MBU4454990.1 hypothetical protein [Patescibacteria group bacterium]